MKELALPKSKEELFKMIDRHLRVAARKELAFATSLSEYHFGLGMWVRNRFVYPSNGEVARLLTGDGSRPSGSADDVSEDILWAYWNYLSVKYDTPKEFEVRCSEMGDESDYHIQYFHTREEARAFIDSRDPQDCLYETWYVVSVPEDKRNPGV